MSAEFKITDELVKQFLYRTGSVGGDITRLYEEWDKFKESKKPKPLLVTEDGKEVFEGDRVWFTYENGNRINFYDFIDMGNRIEDLKHYPDKHKYFSSHEAASNWLLYNKPLLSLNEIESIGQIQDSDQNIYFKRLVKAAKDKLNQ